MGHEAHDLNRIIPSSSDTRKNVSLELGERANLMRNVDRSADVDLVDTVIWPVGLQPLSVRAHHEVPLRRRTEASWVLADVSPHR